MKTFRVSYFQNRATLHLDRMVFVLTIELVSA